MSSVLGVSVGAGAIRLARPPAGTAPGSVADGAVPESFELRTFVVPPETPSAERAALSVAAALNSNPAICATVLACRDEQQARALHTAMNEHALTGYEIVPDIDAVVEFAAAAGVLQDVTSLAVFDLGASGLSVTVVDVSTRQVRHTERTGDISGEYFDSLIREQQINSGRIAHPPGPAGLAELDALCRSAKERLSAGNAVALPSSYGPVLLTQENFTALIARAVETAARATREIIERSGRPVQAVLAVGGGVRIPLVSRALRDAVDMPVLVPPEPETATARGAALLAGRVRAPRAGEPARTSDTALDDRRFAAVAEDTAHAPAALGHPGDSGANPLQSDAGRALCVPTPDPGMDTAHAGNTTPTSAPLAHSGDTISALPAAAAAPTGAAPAYSGSLPAPPATTAHPQTSPAPAGTEPGATVAQLRLAVHTNPASAPADATTRLTTPADGAGRLTLINGPETTTTTHSESPADPLSAVGSDRSRPALPVPHEGIFGPPTGDPSVLSSAGYLSLRSGEEPDTEEPAPDSSAPRPLDTPVPRLSPDEDPPTVALRLPAKLLPRRSFGAPPQRPRREISAAMVAVSALVVVASIGVGLGYGQHMFSQDSATVQDTSQPPTTSAGTPTATTVPNATTTTRAEHAPLAEPPPVYRPEPEAPTTTTTGPNTFQVPGLPPIVVPTIPPEAFPFPRPTPADR
ncbi:FGGY-family carbohydrate kinase [Nocardia carnea]|uniref:FGGY-family carbohydrate kinase n=1 Tax=Nocardia carnea TaxID=37328 RepID=UPI0024552F69|nr:FGGY-family carbohydrate kinase [Nocardia carnea]